MDFPLEGYLKALPAKTLDPRPWTLDPRPHQSANFLTARVALCPPKPNAFERATFTSRFTILFGAESRSHSGSGVNWLMVGGISPRVRSFRSLRVLVLGVSE